MTGSVDYSVNNAIAVITVNNPPVNALSQPIRAGLDAAITRFAEDPSARIALILGAGAMFLSGADIEEFGRPVRPPFLRDVVNRIESSAKPIVAAIHGAALGGGLETALAAHYRLALPGARLGLPEALLGLIPSAGGTQRLPRLTGAEEALKMMTTGAHVDADRALSLGLVDRLGKTGDALAEGLDFAADLLARAAPPRPVSALRPPEIDAEDLHRWRVRLTGGARGHVAPLAVVDAVEAALEQKFAAGLNEERKLNRDLMETPQRAALMYAFLADRSLAALPELAGVAPRRLRHLGIIGGGAMGAALAAAALANGLRVTVVERSPDAAGRARDAIAGLVDADILQDRIDPGRRAALLDQALTVSAGPDQLSECEMAIEAVPEDADLKRQVFETLGRICAPETVLASATAALDLDALAEAAGDHARVIGLHAFAPAPEMPLIEVAATDRSAPGAVATAFALVNRLGRTAVRARARPGYIGARILARCRAAADRMVLDGASPYQVDTALCDFGLAHGPFERTDIEGLARLAPSDCAAADLYDALSRNGWLGRAAGRGFYRYDTGDPEGLPDPEVELLVARARHDAGLTPRRLTDNEVVRRHLAALVNEASNVLAEGVAARPLDIDMVLVHGGGFPRWRGGPMHYADKAGLATILADIERYGETDPDFWRPAPLLSELVASRKTFASLNQF